MESIPINKRKLKELIKECKHFNIFPIYLPNYLPDVSKHAISKLIGELVEEGAQYLSILPKIEIGHIVNNLPPGLKMMVDYSSENSMKNLKRIAVYYIIARMQEDYYSFKDVIKTDINKSEVLKIYPELKKKIDKDGLLCIDDSFQLLDGGIEYRDHILHYHQFLRRGYTSNPNFDFLVKFKSYYYNNYSTNQFRIAIDHQRIMPKEFYIRIFEFDMWFGPHFDRKNLDDPNSLGLTVVKRNKDSLFELTNSLDRTEFFWSFHDGIKTFQIEEVSSFGYQFQDYYLNKYVHSERDIKGKILQHFDGAVKVYLQDNYQARLNSSIPKEIKSYKKIKLFRIDGNIDIDDWIELVAFFYKSNEMIIEYFDPKQYKQIFEERIRDFAAWKQKQIK